MVPLLAFLSHHSSLLYLLLPFLNGTVQFSCTFFICWPIVLRFVQNHSMGDGSYPGWNFCSLHLDCGCFSRGNWPICPCLEQLCGGWPSVRPWVVLSDLEVCDIGCSFRLLSLLGCNATGGGRIFFHLGPSCGIGDCLKFPLCQIIYSCWNGCGC